MSLTIIVAILGVAFFITTVNFYFQKSKYKYLIKAQKQQLNVFNSPSAWMTYSIIIATAIGIILCYSFIIMTTSFSNVGKQQDSLNQQLQQQTDTSSQQSTYSN